MTKECQMTNDENKPIDKYDLEERTARFGEAIIAFAKKVPRNVVTIPLIGQLVRAGTSVGSNYCEADDAVSKKEFRLKIGTCKKEARESKHWLRMIAAAEEMMKDAARPLWQEAKELPIQVRNYIREHSLYSDVQQVASGG